MANRANFFGTLQKLGQALMVPVSVLPAAGLVVALGRALQGISPDSSFHFLVVVGQLFYSGGLAVFEQLPVIFAAGVAIGFSGGAGVAALSSVAGYFTLTSLLKVMTETRALELPINTGVFGGIVIGLLSAFLYNRYHKTRLNPVFGFFAGKRLVPILTVFYTLFVGLALGFVWPPIQAQINEFGLWVMQSEYGAAFYAAGKRLLIPVGLHHVYYPSFLFQFGEFATATGEIVHGDSARYFAGDHTAGIFMASEFPIMLFGLPAAALAMILRAKPENRKAVAGVMISAALTSIITGITEPIEFAFIFVAPLLYVVHVALAFVSGALTTAFDVHLGYTFSASLIDYVLGFFNQKNSWALWAIIGPAMAALYFGIFYTLIGIFNFKTPGREDETAADLGDETIGTERSLQILQALGGTENVESLDACITRLRVQVRNTGLVQKDEMKRLGASGLMDAGNGSIQIVFGVESDQLKEEIQAHMRRSAAGPSLSTSTNSASLSPLGTAPMAASSLMTGAGAVRAGKRLISFGAPMKGEFLPLSKIPDSVFSSGTIGEGFAIRPQEGVVYSPFDGEVMQVFRTNHALGLVSEEGLEALIHIGIDTVKMNGQGFKAFVKPGDKVRKGQKLMEFDLNLVRELAKSEITPVILTNAKLKDLSWTKNSGTVAVQEKVLDVDFQ